MYVAKRSGWNSHLLALSVEASFNADGRYAPSSKSRYLFRPASLTRCENNHPSLLDDRLVLETNSTGALLVQRALNYCQILSNHQAGDHTHANYRHSSLDDAICACVPSVNIGGNDLFFAFLESQEENPCLCTTVTGPVWKIDPAIDRFQGETIHSIRSPRRNPAAIGLRLLIVAFLAVTGLCSDSVGGVAQLKVTKSCGIVLITKKCLHVCDLQAL